MEKLLWIGAAGAVGTLARYGVGLLAQRYAPSSFPWAVLAVNLVGSFLFGMVWALAEEKSWVSANARLVILTGFMGAFTTFSTFAFDNANMVRAASWGYLAANLVLSNLAGIALVFAGFRTARAF